MELGQIVGLVLGFILIGGAIFIVIKGEIHTHQENKWFKERFDSARASGCHVCKRKPEDGVFLWGNYKDKLFWYYPKFYCEDCETQRKDLEQLMLYRSQ